MFDAIKFPIPGHLFWVYLTGAALLAAGVSILINWQTRLATTAIGIMLLVFDLLTWGPRFFPHPGALAGNWLKDLGVIGGVLILASALRSQQLAGSTASDVIAAKSAS
jgi:putative oxidoreductase